MNVKEATGKSFHFDNLFWENPLRCGFLDLYQIGELCCERGFCVPEHVQGVCEITYVISGKGYSFTDGVQTRLTEGDVIVNSIGHRHSIVADSIDILRFAYLGFCFNEAAAEPEFDALREFYEKTPCHHTKDCNDIQFPFLRCMGEFYAQMPYSTAMIRNYCESIVMLAARDSLPGREAVLKRNSSGGPVSSAVYAVIRYVDEHLCDIGSIQELARKLGYNYTYLSHFFKDRTGTTLQKYLSYKKIEYALRLLKYGEMSATEIAAHLRYESVQSFSKAFRRVMGATPTKYLEQERAARENDVAEPHSTVMPEPKKERNAAP